MPKLPFVAALLMAAMVPPSAPAAAKGKPPPPVSSEYCIDDGDFTRCFYDSFNECMAELRALKRHQAMVFSACFLNTTDHEGKYELTYLL